MGKRFQMKTDILAVRPAREQAVNSPRNVKLSADVAPVTCVRAPRSPAGGNGVGGGGGEGGGGADGLRRRRRVSDVL